MEEKLRLGRIVPLSLYGLTMVWSPMFGTSEAVVFPALAPFENELFLSRVASLAAFGLSMLALSLLGERIREAIGSPPIQAAFVAVGAIGMLIGSLVGTGTLPPGLLCVGGFMRGVYYTAISVLWIGLFTSLGKRTIGAAVSASLVAYASVGLAIAAVSALSPALSSALLFACPIVCWWGYRRSSSLVVAEAAQVKDRRAREGEPPPLHTKVMLYAANFLYGIMLGMVLHYFAMSDTVAGISAFLAMSAVMVGVMLSPLGTMSLHFLYRAFMMAVSALIPVLVLTGWLGLSSASIVISTILAVMIFYTVVIFSDTQARMTRPFWKVPGVCQLFAAIGMIASSTAFRFLLSNEASSQDLMLVSAACVIFVASVFSPSDRSQVRPWGFSSLIPSESTEIRRLRRCGEVANEFRLTSRELEILQQMADGATKEEIAATLVISPATAKTHIRNIYAKLGIHSQKELRQLIEG